MNNNFLGLALLLTGFAANAETLIYLQAPTGVVVNGQSTCVAHVVNADDSVSGTCQSVTRFSRPYIADVYVATWNTAGAVLSSAKCGTLTQSGPYKSWSYQPGSGVATCYLPVYSSPPLTAELLTTPSGSQGWYNYITTAPNGSFRLFTDRFHGLIVTP